MQVVQVIEIVHCVATVALIDSPIECSSYFNVLFWPRSHRGSICKTDEAAYG